MDEEIPKAQWGPGPWQGEPDELEWVDLATGYTCRIRRNMFVTGALCGYVGVPPLHAAYGFDYDGGLYRPGKLPSQGFGQISGIGDAITRIRVHDGVTYAYPSCLFKGEKRHRRRLWWYGFSCAGSGDTMPMLEATLNLAYSKLGKVRSHHSIFAGATYKTIEYARDEVTSLAQQLADLEEPFSVTGDTIANPAEYFREAPRRRRKMP